MKALTATLLCGLFLFAGCKQESAPPPPAPPEPTVEAEPAAPAETTLKDVTDTAGAYASQQAEKVAEASQEQLAEMQAKFDELKVAAAEQGEAAKSKLAELKTKFDAQVAAAQVKLDEFKEANAPRTEQIQKDLSSAVSEANAILKDAWARFGAGETPAADNEATP